VKNRSQFVGVYGGKDDELKSEGWMMTVKLVKI